MAKKNKVLSTIGSWIMTIAAFALACGIIYGCYWLAKTGSYAFFYEDMVVKTITQTVKPEYLQ